MNNLVLATYNGVKVSFRDDGWINATQVAKFFGKKPDTYLKTDRTQAYLNALKSAFEENQLVTAIQGSSETGGGTWFHPKLGVDFFGHKGVTAC